MEQLPHIIGLLIAATAFITMVKIVANAALRIQNAKRGPDMLGHDYALEQRLARIEIAVDAIAMEVERAGELQRFTAQLHAVADGSPPALAQPQASEIARPITPH